VNHIEINIFEIEKGYINIMEKYITNEIEFGHILLNSPKVFYKLLNGIHKNSGTDGKTGILNSTAEYKTAEPHTPSLPVT